MMLTQIPDPTNPVADQDLFVVWSLLYAEGNLGEAEKIEFENILRASEEARTAFAIALQADTALYEQSRQEVEAIDGVCALPTVQATENAPGRQPVRNKVSRRSRRLSPVAGTRIQPRESRPRNSASARQPEQWSRVSLMAAASVMLLATVYYFWGSNSADNLAVLDSAAKEVIVHHGTLDLNAVPGMSIGLGDIIDVPINATAQVRYSDRTSITLNSAAMLAFEHSSIGGKQVFLSRGSVTADVAKQPAGKPMIFYTPQAESIVIGTRLTLAIRDEATRLDVHEGNVKMTRTSDQAFVQVKTSQYAVADKHLALVVKEISSLALLNSVHIPERFNYGEALQKAAAFYEAQRSGKLPSKNRIEWRGDSGLHDGADNGVDLTGGWYDSGDHVKFGFPMASSVTLLSWGLVEYHEAYASSGQLPYMLDNIRWATDYLMKAHTAPNELWAQVGSGTMDHSWWGPPEVMQMQRPSFKIDAAHPGSDLAGETAAALAAASVVFETTDKAYAERLLVHSKQLFEFADKYRGRYSDSITDAQGYYNSTSGYWDELVWGAAWLYRATHDAKYLKTAEEYYGHLNTEPQSSVRAYKRTHSWDDKSYGARVLLASFTHQDLYIQDTERWLDYWTEGYHGQRITYTPGGLAWLESVGPLRYAANTAFLALIYSDSLASTHPKKKVYHDFAMRQINYALGRNPSARSYVVGFGLNPPQNPHHRAAHGSWLDNIQIPAVNRHVLFGALVGGPGFSDNYLDERTNYIGNEVCCEYNAGFTGALARLYKEFGGSPLANFPPAEQREDEFYAEAQVNASSVNFTELRIQINNRSRWPARVTSDLRARYFVDLSEVFKAGYTLNDVKVTMNFSQGASVSGLRAWDPSNHIYFVEISFAGIPIFPGGQSVFRKEAQLRLALPGSAKPDSWNPNNDWSYAGLGGSAAPVKTHNIPIYEAGVKLFGKEPPGSPR